METRTVSTQIDIAAPIEIVWQLLTDLPRYRSWNDYLVDGEGNPFKDQQVRVTARSAAGEINHLDVQVERITPYEMVWIGGLPDLGKFRGEHWFVLESSGGSTRLNHFEHFTGSMAEAILSDLRETITDNFERMNHSLKAEAERLSRAGA